MNIADYLEDEGALVGAVASLSGESLSRVAVKAFCLGRLLKKHGPGDTFTVEDAVIVAEELSVPLSEQAMICTDGLAGSVSMTASAASFARSRRDLSTRSVKRPGRWVG